MAGNLDRLNHSTSMYLYGLVGWLRPEPSVLAGYSLPASHMVCFSLAMLEPQKRSFIAANVQFGPRAQRVISHKESGAPEHRGQNYHSSTRC